MEPLPPSAKYPTAHDAHVAVIVAGYRVAEVAGTGSMAPWIPRAPAGYNPHTTVVAYAGLDGTTYDELKPGMVVVYSKFGVPVIHRLGTKDARGFIAYGSANGGKDRSASGELGFVTPYTFIGRVAFVATYSL
jgi:hypothetical protein